MTIALYKFTFTITVTINSQKLVETSLAGLTLAVPAMTSDGGTAGSEPSRVEHST